MPPGLEEIVMDPGGRDAQDLLPDLGNQAFCRGLRSYSLGATPSGSSISVDEELAVVLSGGCPRNCLDASESTGACRPEPVVNLDLAQPACDPVLLSRREITAKTL